MAKEINIGIGGVVKKVKEVPIGIGGVVKEAKKGVCGVGGVVKEFFSSNNDLVLWDGSSAQNGATAGSGNKSISYEFTTGELAGKYIILKVKKKCTYCHFRMLTYKGSTTIKSNAKNSDGTNYTTSTGGSTWNVGTEYIFEFSKLTGHDTANKLAFSFFIDLTDEVGNEATNLTETVAYIAIR